MRILAVADVVDPILYDAQDRLRWAPGAVDAVVSCGDLPGDYLTFLADQLACPVLYVRGNHDGAYNHEPPLRCIDIDGRLLNWRGLRLLGLGGAPPHNGGTEQYSEGAMRRRALRRRFGIWRLGGLDLIVTHAPPTFAEASLPFPGHRASGADAFPGRPPALVAGPGHRGFRAFAALIRRYHPAALVHGHTHLPYGASGREQTLGGTRIVNAYGHYLLDLAEPTPH